MSHEQPNWTSRESDNPFHQGSIEGMNWETERRTVHGLHNMWDRGRTTDGSAEPSGAAIEEGLAAIWKLFKGVFRLARWVIIGYFLLWAIHLVLQVVLSGGGN